MAETIQPPVTPEVTTQADGDTSERQEADLPSGETKQFVVVIRDIDGKKQVGWPGEAWSMGDEPGKNWLRDMFPDAHYTFAGDDPRPGIYSFFPKSELIKAAEDLLLQLQRARRHLEVISNHQKTKRPVAFVSHGLGGLLVKACLVLASPVDSPYHDIFESTQALIFFGYPHRPLRDQTLRDDLIGHFMKREVTFPPGELSSMVDTVCSLIQRVNVLFDHTKITLRVLMWDLVSSSEIDPGFPDPTLRSNTLLAVRRESVKTHADLIRLDRDLFDRLRNHIESFMERDDDFDIDEWTLQSLCSQSLPEFQSSRRPRERYELDENLTGALDAIITADENMLLWVASSSPALPWHFDELNFRIRTYLGQHPTKQEVVPCRFDRHDIRASTPAVILRTLLCQLCYSLEASEWADCKGIAKEMRQLRSLSLDHLYHYWSLVLDGMQALDRQRLIIYTFENLDDCDDAVQMINLLQRRLENDGARFRVIVTSSEALATKLQPSLEGLPDGVLRWAGPTNFKEPKLAELSGIPEALQLSWLPDKQPRYSHGDFPAAIAGVIKAFTDPQANNMVQAWLENTRQRRDLILNQLALLQSKPEPSVLFETLLLGIPEDRVVITRQVLTWVLLAVRPLRTEELLLALQVTVPTSETETIQELEHCPLLTIQHDEVHLAHPQLRTWLESCEWLQLESISLGHLKMLQDCLAILESPPASLPQPNWPSVNALAYAAQYWNEHYKQARYAPEPAFRSATQAVIGFVKNEAAFGRFVAMYRDLADPFTLPPSAPMHPFALAAHFGLEELLEALGQDEEHLDTSGFLDGLVEAARQGHSDMVARILVNKFPPEFQFAVESGDTRELVEAASFYANEAVLRQILPRIPDRETSDEPAPDWVSQLVPRACFLGSEFLLRKLVALGADINTPHINPGGSLITPLELAVVANAGEVIQLLLQDGSKLAPEYGLDCKRLVRVYARWANPQTLHLLLDKGMKPEALNVRNWPALHIGVEWGRFNTVSTLLERHKLDEFRGDPDDPVEPPLMLAARFGRNRLVKLLLEHGADPNQAHGDSTVIKAAVSSGKFSTCQLILSSENQTDGRKVDVNFVPDVDGAVSPLYEAIKDEYPDRVRVVRLLLEHQANVQGRSKDDWGRTILLLAASRGGDDMAEVMKLLLDAGADVEAKDTDGWAPMYTAVKYSTPEVVKLLHSAKADLLVPCDYNQNALHAASTQPDMIRALRELDKNLDFTERYQADTSPLELATESINIECVRLMLEEPAKSAISKAAALERAVAYRFREIAELLLDDGVAVNDDSFREPLLCKAMWSTSEPMVRAILEFRPDIEARNEFSQTALHCIGPNTPLAAVKLVMRAGASLEVMDKNKYTPFSQAVRVKNWEVTKYMMGLKSFLPLLRGSTGFASPLPMACRYGTMEIVKRLVELGADVNCQFEENGSLCTPLELACQWWEGMDRVSKGSVVEYLVEECNANVGELEKSESPIHSASYFLAPNIIRLLLSKGAKADDVGGPMKRRPFHLACYNSLEALKALEPSTANFSVRDAFGRLPLHYAVIRGDVELVQFVLDQTIAAGLGIDEKDEDGWTPLMWAARTTNLYGWDMDASRETVLESAQANVRLLLDKGADKDNRGRVRQHGAPQADFTVWSAAQVARYHGATEIAELLEVPPLDEHPDKKSQGVESALCCDGCYVRLWGYYHTCLSCIDFYFCFKCYEHRNRIHPEDHDFLDEGSLEERGSDGSPEVEQHEVPGLDETTANEGETPGEEGGEGKEDVHPAADYDDEDFDDEDDFEAD